MSYSDLAELWQQVLDRIRPELSETSFKAWFATIKFLRADGNQLVLEMPSTVNLNMMKSRYLNMLNTAIAQVSENRYSARLVLPGEYMPEAEPVPQPVANMLNPKYTFETFVVGASNRFAHAASLAVAEMPADAYNPLFLYGGVGLGKTHLMHAIGHYIQEQNPSANLLYITSENFTNELITAISKKTNQQMRDRFRNVDVLMVDDIQFIAGRTSTQEEFFHTFNELHSAGKQIIISSDRPPKEIPTLEERLRSRFEWGLIADIQKPDYETRVAILRKKAESERIPVDDEVLHFIAEKIESNIRELEGSLTRIMAYAALTGGEINLSMAEDALKNIITVKDMKRITPELIQQVVSSFYEISPADLISQRRNREVALPRQIAMYLTRQLTDLSTTRIGEEFGGRDHTTVMHASDKIAEMCRTNPKMRETLEDLKKLVREK